MGVGSGESVWRSYVWSQPWEGDSQEKIQVKSISGTGTASVSNTLPKAKHLGRAGAEVRIQVIPCQGLFAQNK